MISISPRIEEAARRRSCAAAMIFAEYRVLPEIEEIFQPIELAAGEWVIQARSLQGAALGYIKEGA